MGCERKVVPREDPGLGYIVIVDRVTETQLEPTYRHLAGSFGRDGLELVFKTSKVFLNAVPAQRGYCQGETTAKQGVENERWQSGSKHERQVVDLDHTAHHQRDGMMKNV